MRRRFRTHRGGNAAIEFAVIGPVFVLAMIAILEVGAQLMTGAMLDYGMRMASRWGVTGNSAPGGASRTDFIRSTIMSASGGFLQSARLTLTVDSAINWSGTGPRTPGAGAGGAVTTYSASYRQPFMTGFATTILGRTEIVHTSRTIVSNEPF